MRIDSAVYSLHVILTELLGPHVGCVTPTAQAGFKGDMEEGENISIKALSGGGGPQN